MASSVAFSLLCTVVAFGLIQVQSIPQGNISQTTAKWISNNKDKLLNDKESLPRAIPALYLFNETYVSKDKADGYKFQSQYLLKLSADLLRNSSRPLTSADLSQHISALLAICRNPRSFYGIDLVARLRELVRTNNSVAKPFDVLTLCNAGENITSKDVENLNATLVLEDTDSYSLDFKVMALMATACAAEQNKEIFASVVENFVNAIPSVASHQSKDGSFGNLRSTALALQVLSFGVDEILWNKSAAWNFLKSSSHMDGSFGNIHDLYAVLPVLGGKNLMYLNSSKCDFTPGGLTPLQEMKDQMFELVSATYELRFGDEATIKYSMAMEFPSGTKFFDVMRLAADKDENFSFRWTLLKGVLYVYQIGRFINDPISGKYWSLFILRSNQDIVLLKKGLEEYVPSDGDTAVMWYKTVDLQR